MQVSLLVLGNRVVDHVSYVVNIDASGGNLGGNQDVFLPAAEGSHRTLTCLLRHVAVQSRCVEAAIDQLFGNLGSLTLGLAEDYGLAATFGLQDATNNFVFVHRVSAVDNLLDVSLGVTLIRVVHADVNRAVLVLACKRNYRSRHGCREQHGLTVGGGVGKKALDIWKES